jgi:hypothetical protein
MKIRTKALVALTVGAAMTTGVGTTFAQWTDSASIGDATVRTGHLSLSNIDSPVVWTVNGQDRPATPGETLVGRTYVDASLAGKNLEATLTTDINGLLTGNWIPQSNLSVDVGDVADGRIPITVSILIPPCQPGGTFAVNSLNMQLNQQRAGQSAGWSQAIDVSFNREGEANIVAPPSIGNLTGMQPNFTNNGVISLHYSIPGPASRIDVAIPSSLQENINLRDIRWTDAGGNPGTGDGSSGNNFTTGDSVPLNEVSSIGPNGGFLTIIVQRTSGGQGAINNSGWFPVELGDEILWAPFPAMRQGFNDWTWPDDASRPDTGTPDTSCTVDGARTALAGIDDLLNLGSEDKSLEEIELVTPEVPVLPIIPDEPIVVVPEVPVNPEPPIIVMPEIPGEPEEPICPDPNPIIPELPEVSPPLVTPAPIDPPVIDMVVPETPENEESNPVVDLPESDEQTLITESSEQDTVTIEHAIMKETEDEIA